MSSLFGLGEPFVDQRRQVIVASLEDINALFQAGDVGLQFNASGISRGLGFIQFANMLQGMAECHFHIHAAIGIVGHYFAVVVGAHGLIASFSCFFKVIC